MASILIMSGEGTNFKTSVSEARRGKKRSVPKDEDIRASSKSPSSFTTSPFTIPPSPLMTKLGFGTGVTVYRFNRVTAQGQVRSPWAVKKAKQVSSTPSVCLPAERLKTESEILRKLKHPNIVAFRNFTRFENGDTILSMEECGRSLDSIIEERKDGDEIFSANDVTKVAVDIARALDYLHNTIKLLHGDIKSANILVSDDFEKVKLCDFGVSLFLMDDLSGLRDPEAFYIGSEPWKSKEVIDYEGPVTDKADIFAYGLVIWEMLTLRVPHIGLIGTGKPILTSSDSCFRFIMMIEKPHSYHFCNL